MTDALNSQVSAFIDDELRDGEGELLIRRLCSDDDLRQTAARYAMIGNAVRGSMEAIRADLSGNIMRAIERDDGQQMEASETPSASRGWLRPLAGGAIAATVALAAVMLVRAPPPEQDPAMLAESAPSETVPEPVPSSTEDLFAPLQQVQTAANPEAARLNRYLLQHSAYSQSFGGQQRVMGLRAVGAGETDPEDKPREDSVRNRAATDGSNPQ